MMKGANCDVIGFSSLYKLTGGGSNFGNETSGETVTAYLSRRNPVKIILYLDRSLNSLTKFNFDGAGHNMNDFLSHNVFTSILNLKSRRQNFYDSFYLSSTSQA